MSLGRVKVWGCQAPAHSRPSREVRYLYPNNFMSCFSCSKHAHVAALKSRGSVVQQATYKHEGPEGITVGPVHHTPRKDRETNEGDNDHLTLSKMTFSSCPSSPESTITLVTHSTPQRLHLIPHLCSLYPHPIILIIQSEVRAMSP